MTRTKVLLLVGLTTMGFQVWSWFLGLALGTWQALAAMLTAGSAATSSGTSVYDRMQEPEEPGVGGPYRGPSQFMPQMGGNRYAPQNRSPQSGISPDILAYLRKYVR